MYQSYADAAYYKDIHNGTALEDDDVDKYLKSASRHIDALTYNRITPRGFAGLTEFQQEIIREVVCVQADFEYTNKDVLDMIISNYSINGVSMQFGTSWNVVINNGIPMKRDLYQQLCQTGLCCRILGW